MQCADHVESECMETTLNHDFFFVRTDGRYVRINYSDIRYIQSDRNYLRIYTEEKFHIVRMNLKRLESLLPSNHFVRVHKSFIIALHRIKEFDHELVYLKNQQIPIGEQYKGVLERALPLFRD